MLTTWGCLLILGRAVYITGCAQYFTELVWSHRWWKIWKLSYVEYIYKSSGFQDTKKKKKKKTQVKGELDHITYIVLNWTYLLKPLQFQYKYWLEYGWVLPLLSVTLCILLGAKCFKLLSSVYFVILKAIFWKKIIEDRKREILWTFFALKKVKKIITRTWSPCYSWLKIKYLYDFWRWGVHCTV